MNKHRVKDDIPIRVINDHNEVHSIDNELRNLYGEVGNAIIEMAVRFWFLDDDWESADKVWCYFRAKNK